MAYVKSCGNIANIKPEVVIVWDEVGTFLHKKGFKKNNEDSNNYIWENDGITFLHCYHPSYSTFIDGENLKKAMTQIWNLNSIQTSE